MAEKLDQDMSNAIAIVGVSCRLPKMVDLESFWESLLRGERLISFFNTKELRKKGVSTALVENPQFVPAGGILDDHDLFDAYFFNLLPREVEVLDPQQRKFLECCYEAWEDAGYTSEYYSGSVGVFGGVTINTYFIEYVAKNQKLMEILGHLQLMIGNDKDFVTTRVSHQLNLTGPSYAIQSACSSSLVAIHAACSSLLNGECDMALAGGSSIRYPHGEGYIYFVGGTSSPDGHCRAFDKDAAGSVVGNGAGVLVLKRYEDAIRDRDHIYSVILGSAIGNDGSDKPAYSTPSASGQARVISDALAMANIDSSTVGYVEAHGTGTYIGDPIEVAALCQAYKAHQSNPDDKYYCVLGSIKPNIGHLDAAAGVSGVIKVIKMLEHKKIPPLVDFREVNPKIDIENSPFQIINTDKDWTRVAELPLRAGISSIGLGGTNAHIILQEPPEQIRSTKEHGLQIIPISARTLDSLEKYLSNFKFFLKNHPTVNLADLAFTMQVGRRTFEYRHVFIASSVPEFLEKITTNSLVADKRNCQVKPSIVFMFPGQGAQYPKMVQTLYNQHLGFRKNLKRCIELINSLTNIDLYAVLFEDTNTDLNQTIYTQPLLFAVEYALAQCWLALGIKPNYLIGHSIGEFVAGCIAGVFSLKDAIEIIIERARLSGELAEGRMLAVIATPDQIRPYLDKYPLVSIAVINSAKRLVLSGDIESISLLTKEINAVGFSVQPVMTSHAFHSSMFDQIIEELEQKISQYSLNPPTIPLISNKTGDFMSAEMACDPAYWASHIRNPVNFYDGLKTLNTFERETIFLEVGPGANLTTLATEVLDKHHVTLASLGHIKSNQSEYEHFYDAIRQLWLHNVRIDWPELHDKPRSRLSLPTYPYELKRYLLEKPSISPQDQETLMENLYDANIPLNWRHTIKDFLDILGNRSVSITIAPTSVAVTQNMPVQQQANSAIETPVNTADPIISQQLATSTISTSHSLREGLLDLWVELLGISKNDIDNNTSITALGAHSLLLTQLLTRIKQRYQVDCSIEDLLNYPTIEKMSNLISKRQGDKISKSKNDIHLNSKAQDQTDTNINEILSLSNEMSEADVEQLLAEVGES